MIRCWGNLLQKMLLLTRTPGVETYFHCSRQDCAHTHTSTQTSHKKCTPPTQHCPPVLLQSRQNRLLDEGTLKGEISPPLCTYCPLLSFNLLFWFQPAFSQSVTHNFPPAMSDQGHLILLNFVRISRHKMCRHSMCWLSHICQVVHMIYQSPASRKERLQVSFIEHCRVWRLTDGQIHWHYVVTLRVTFFCWFLSCSAEIRTWLGSSWIWGTNCRIMLKQRQTQWRTVPLQSFLCSSARYFLFITPFHTPAQTIG